MNSKNIGIRNAGRSLRISKNLINNVGENLLKGVQDNALISDETAKLFEKLKSESNIASEKEEDIND